MLLDASDDSDAPPVCAPALFAFAIGKLIISAAPSSKLEIFSTTLFATFLLTGVTLFAASFPLSLAPINPSVKLNPPLLVV